MREKSCWVWIFGEIQGLRWVLEKKTMAFGRHAAPRVQRIKPGDEAILYVTRGAFHNPTRDQSRLAGIVEVSGEVRRTKPVEIGGRELELQVPFRPVIVLPEREGPEVGSLAAKLSVVKRPEVWGHYFRVSPLAILAADFRLLRTALVDWQKNEA